MSEKGRNIQSLPHSCYTTCQDNSWTNADLSSVRPSDIHRMVVLQEVHHQQLQKLNWKLLILNYIQISQGLALTHRTTKLPALGKKHFEMHLHQWKLFHLDCDCSDVCSQRSNYQRISIDSGKRWTNETKLCIDVKQQTHILSFN